MDQLPKAGNLLKPVLLALISLGGSGSVEEIEREVIRSLNVSDQIASLIRSGRRTELNYRLSWARTRGKNLGYIERKSFKVWVITEKGKTAILN